MRARASATRLAGVLIAALLVATVASSAREEPGADEDLRARIEARLAELPDGVGPEIRVRVEAGRVLLQGRVALLEHALRAEQLTWTTPGVRDVDNELRVVSVEPGGDAAIERRVRLILKDDGRFEYTSLELTVRSGRVALRGVFPNPIDVLRLKHRIASIPGVRDVRIDAVLLAGRDAGAPRPA